MAEELFLDEAQLKVKNPQRLIWMLVRDAFDLLWVDNPKLHDIGELVSSIKKYGFKPPPQYDGTLEAIVDGNGRTEALAWMENQDEELPDGLAIHEATGVWAMPVLVGNDAKSVEFAKAYAVDANNLTLSGGDLTLWDKARLWDAEYSNVLLDLAQRDTLPLTVDGDDLDALLKDAGALSEPFDFGDFEPEAKSFDSGYVNFKFGNHGGKVSQSIYELFVTAYNAKRDESGAASLDAVLLEWLGLDE
jgi:hypothetical protein